MNEVDKDLLKKIQKRNKYILRLRKKGLTLSMIKVLVKEKFGMTLSRERINQIIKGRLIKNKND